MQFIPTLNSVNGLTLTPLQWQTSGVNFVGLDISLLLQRPGYLKVWKKKIGFKYLLDASHLKQNAKGDITYRSHDGALKHLTLENLASWISEYQPDALIWPFTTNFEFKNNPIMLVKREDGCLVEPHGAVLGTMSSEPCDKAVQGFFKDNDFFNIQSEHYAEDLNVLKTGCDCQACQGHLTRAYLHHLYEHTPLLAHRFLIVHNVRQMVLEMQAN